MDRDALNKSLLVFLGAGLGANARYWLGLLVQQKTGPVFPWGTFTINVTGSIAIGLVWAWLVHVPGTNPWRLIVVTGFLGGYTTFSSFSLETINLIQTRSYTLALAYVVGSCLLSFVGTWIGFAGARSFLG